MDRRRTRHAIGPMNARLLQQKARDLRRARSVLDDLRERRTNMKLARGLAAGAALMAMTIGTGCSVDSADGSNDEVDGSSEDALGGLNLRIGYAGWGNLKVFDNPRYNDIFTRTDGHANARMCHAYPRYDIAEKAGVDPTRDEQRAHFQEWHDRALADHCEMSVAFKAVNQHHQTNSPKIVPSETEYENGFKAFRKAYPDVHVFSMWNEPNNDEGAETSLTPEEAAKFFLLARKNCKPQDGCHVAAGDFASWHGWMGGVEMQCSNDPDKLCDHGSYLDNFKYQVDHFSESYGLGAHFRPENFGFHPWHDSFAYSEAHSHCGSAKTCMTRAMLESLGGSWSHAHLWATEVALENPSMPGHSQDFAQACGASFLLRLFATSSRITRLYYFDTGGLIDGSSPDTIKVLANRTQHFSPACF